MTDKDGPAGSHNIRKGNTRKPKEGKNKKSQKDGNY